MNTTEDSSGRSVAVVHAELAADSWSSAVVSQRHAGPEHSDFYALAGSMVDTLHALAQMSVLLREQVAGYGTGRTLRDDEPGRDPAERVTEACALSYLMQAGLDTAQRATSGFWSEVGHIAVEDPA